MKRLNNNKITPEKIEKGEAHTKMGNLLSLGIKEALKNVVVNKQPEKKEELEKKADDGSPLRELNLSLETLTQGSPPPTHRPSKKEEARSLSLRNYAKGVDLDKLKAFSYGHVAKHIDAAPIL